MNWKGLSLNWNLLRKSRPKLGCTCLQTPWKGLLDQHCCSLLEEASDFRTIVQNFCTFVQSALALVSMSITDQLLRLKIPSLGLLLWSCHSFTANQQVLYRHCFFLNCTNSLLSTFSSHQVSFAFQCGCPPYISRFWTQVRAGKLYNACLIKGGRCFFNQYLMRNDPIVKC